MNNSTANKGILESIVWNSGQGRQVYTARAGNGFVREIDQRNVDDRAYIIEVVDIALQQMNTGIFYGTIKRGELLRLRDYMELYIEMEANT
jgi:hypothetical protein